MTRRHLTVFAVVVVLVLAGCSGPSTDNAANDGSTTNGPATPVRETTPATGVLDDPSQNVSPGASTTWVSSKRLDTHIAAVASRGSATVERNLTITSAGESMTFSYETRMDIAGGEVRRNASMPLVSLQRKYTTARATYVWTTFAYKNRTMDTYDVYRSPYSTASHPINGSVELGRTHLNLGVLRVVHEGNTTVEGVNVTRYRAYGIESVSLPDTQATENAETLESFNATFLVDRDGIIRYAAWNATVSGSDGANLRHIRYEQSVSALGNTTVTEPSWLDRVRRNA